ncbi:hypothetical protein M0R45_026026 [Rubus argutus]|uniref:Aspartic peptidase DDI1-type domain-containing protein n=1 Tax=Rubus argutus TaxID=59490 RepID=A0AAW1WXR4_RUBAR
MEQWNYSWDYSRNFEHPWYFQNQCIEPPHPLLPYFEMTAAYLQKSLTDDDERWRETQERSAKIDYLIEKIEANRLFEQDQELTNQQPCEFSDPNPLLVHHEFTLKEDGNREEELVLPGIGLGDYDTVLSRSNKGVDKEAGGEENVPSGERVLDGYSENALKPRHSEAVKKKKKKKKGLMSEVFDIFKSADVNFPLLDLISQVPTYAEFVRNLCMHKKKLHEGEKFVLKEEVSAIIQRKLFPNIHDPTSFVIGCTIGEHFFKGALMDMGTSINIMPLATFRKLAIGSLQPTFISVQLADGTFKMSLGIVEDVLIRVDKFILPADFVILDMDEDPELENGLPVILGRPFMAMAGAKINVQKGTVKLKVLGEKVKLQVLQPAFPHNVIKDVLSTDFVKGNQAKSERIFGPLNPPKPLDQDHSSVVAANQELQELSYWDDDDDDMFEDFVNSYGKNDRDFAFSSLESEPDIIVASLPVHKIEAPSTYVPPDLNLDPYSSDPQTSSFRQIHQVDGSTTTSQRIEVVQPTSTIHERDRGILPTPYVPPHRRMFMPTPYLHPNEHILSSSFESFKMRSPPCSEVQLEAIQCLRNILGIGENRMKVHEWYPSPFSDYKSMATPYMSYYGGRQMYFAPP